MVEYLILGKSGCFYCNKAKALLTQKGLTFEYVDVEQDLEALGKIVDSGWNTVPQIFKGGSHLGGYEQLEKLLVSNS